MDLFTAIKTRRSVRSYVKNAEIPYANLEEIAGAGRFAPSARSVNPYRFVVISEGVRLEALSRIIGTNGKFIKDASAAIITACEDTKYYLEDGCAATENILLAAHSFGYGACWIAGDKKEYCADVLKFVNAPEGYKLVSVISLGLPDENPVKEKLGLEKAVVRERF